MSQQTIKFGTKELTGEFAGKQFDELPDLLENAYDLEVPSDCEYVVDGDVKEGSDTILDRDSIIEIGAVAGKKA